MSNIKKLKDLPHKTFELKSKGDKRAELVLYGTIGNSFWEEGITATSVVEAIKNFGDISHMDIRINSMGGDVFDGVTIYNRIKQLKATKTVYVDGLAASIASIIAMAGDEIIMSEGSLFMVHKPLTGTYGNAADFENSISILNTIEEEMITIYAKKTKKSRSDLRKMLLEETWMNSDMAMELGFATSVSDVKVAAVADAEYKFFSSKYRHCPKNILTRDQEIKRKLENNVVEIRDFLARK